MAESIFKGYLINKVDYLLNDEIVTFITEDGAKLPCLSMGSRKISSKNGRNLFLGNYCEFEIFLARNAAKMSRLKKCQAITQTDWKLSLYQPFNLLCECVNRTIETNHYTYLFFKNMLAMINDSKYSEKTKILIILQKFCILSGIGLEVNCCVECGNKCLKTINFKKRGMVCNLHFNKNKDHLYSLRISKLFHYLFNEKYDELNIFFDEFNFAIKILKEYIDHNLGIKLFTINNY